MIVTTMRTPKSVPMPLECQSSPASRGPTISLAEEPFGDHRRQRGAWMARLHQLIPAPSSCSQLCRASIRQSLNRDESLLIWIKMRDLSSQFHLALISICETGSMHDSNLAGTVYCVPVIDDERLPALAHLSLRSAPAWYGRQRVRAAGGMWRTEKDWLSSIVILVANWVS